MAALSTALAVTSGAIGLGKGIVDTISGDKIASSAKKKLDAYERQDLTNSFAGLSVPTSGFEMEKTAAMGSEAEASAMLSQGGARSAIGGVSALSESTRGKMQDISSRLTNAEFRLKEMIAEDESRIRQMQESREESDIAGLGSQIAYGRSMKSAGVNTAISSAASLAEFFYYKEQDSKDGLSAKPYYSKPDYARASSPYTVPNPTPAPSVWEDQNKWNYIK